MSKDIREDVFINYYMQKRTMRRTHDPELLGNIYASKYANWVLPFFKSHGIAEAPLLLSCNTLYLLPDFFTIHGKSFFVADYYLHSYFYDFNYALSNVARKEFTLNLYIKTFIEQAYLKGDLDLTFSLCQTSPTIEIYKKSNDYRNKELSIYLVEKTDLQEAMTFLHEATHLLYKIDDKVCENKIYQEIVDIFGAVMPSLSEAFFEECYCDYSSITYILEKTYFTTQLSHEEYFLTLFFTLIYIYTIYLIMNFSIIDESERFQDVNYEQQMLYFRFGGIHVHIYRFLLASGKKDDVLYLNSAYQNAQKFFDQIVTEVKEVLRLVSNEGKQNQEYFKNITVQQKKEYIRDFLCLINF